MNKQVCCLRNKGFYLYCIKQKTDFEFSTEGIDGDKVFTFPCQDLEAVVSKVSLENFSSEDLQRKAQEDLGWIKEKALIHEKVMEEAMGKDKTLSVIPMKFGIIFKTEEKLAEILNKDYFKFKKILENLAGKQEWSVKVYLNRKSFEEEIKKVSPQVKDKEKEIASMPEGMAYFMENQIDELVSKEVDESLQEYIESFFENLKKHAEAGARGKILEKELTGGTFPMVLNAIFLVSEEKLKGFVKEINELNGEYKSIGFNFEYSGPWPPYNFIS